MKNFSPTEVLRSLFNLEATPRQTKLQQLSKACFALLLFCGWHTANAQLTYTDDFSANTSATQVTSGLMGTSGTNNWFVTRSGADWGAIRSNTTSQLELTNDVGATTNANGWVFAQTVTQHHPTLNLNTDVTWSFNMRQITSDPGGFAAGSAGVAFLLAGSSATAATAGQGYAVVLGQSGTTDPVRLVSYNNGLQGTLTDIVTSNTTGLTDFGADYLSIRVVYTAATNTWELLLRNDGATAFADPSTGTLTSQGTPVANSTYTGTTLSFMGAYWQGGTAANQTAFFDNVKVVANTGAFVTTWIPGGTATSLTIPTTGTGYNYAATCQNMTTSTTAATALTAQTGDATFSGLTSASTYRVFVTGTFPRIYFWFSNETTKIRTIEQWGTIAWTSMRNAFYGCNNLTTATGNPVLTGVTDMSFMFYDCTNFNGNITGWNTATVTNMSNMFGSCGKFNANISIWNTAAVTNMSNMFSSCGKFNQPIGTWNTAAVTNMESMFQYSAFNQDISIWKTAAVTNMNNMFRSTPFNQDIGTWTTSAVTNMQGMFASTPFNQDISIWNTAAVTNMAGMFNDARAFNQPIGTWTTSAVTDMSYMFYQAYAFNQPIGTWTTSAVTNMSNMFKRASAFNQPIGTWTTSAVTDMSYMFNDAFNFNRPIGTWTTSAVTNMSNMFDNAYAFNQPIGTWTTSAVTDMSNMFYNAQAFNQNLGKWTLNSNVIINTMLAGSSMDCANYSATLVGWAAQPSLPEFIQLGAYGIKYGTDATTARNILTTTKFWNIYDDGVSTGTCLSPEINVQGNSNNITDGSTTPSTTNHTDFGSVAIGSTLVRTFTIQNLGGATLTMSGSIMSSNTKFKIGVTPKIVSAGALATFTVTYTPTASGTDNATITINNNDSDEAVYDFAIAGVGYFNVGTPVFTAGATSICVSATDTYTATASNSTSITYSIVGGTGATINSSTGVVSNVIGNFTVRATATGATGPNTTADRVVMVTPNVGTPSFSAGATSLCAGGTSTYTASASNSTSIVYSILNGTGASINSSTGAVSAVTGNFTVVATASGTCGTNTTANRVVTVTPNVGTPSFSAGAITLCVGGTDTYTASASNSTSIVYSILNGTGASINSSTGVVSAVTGNFTVVATASGTCGTNTTVNRVVTVTPNVGTPSFSAGATSLCAGGTSTYTASASNSSSIVYSILNGTGASINSSTGAVSAVTGNFTVVATASGTCGSNTTVNRVVTVTPNVGTPSFSAGATSLCVGGTDTYTASASNSSSIVYSILNGTGASINSSTGVVSAVTGNFTVVATASGTCGSNTTVNRAVTVTQNVATPVFTAGATSLCAGGTSTYTATASNSSSIVYSILNGTGASISSSTGAVSTVTGSFTVVATASGTCGSNTTANRAVTVNALPTVSITGATSIAVGASTNLSPTSGGAWVSNNAAATVTNGGVVTGVSVGSATFTFTQTSTGCPATSPAVTITAACTPTPTPTGTLVWNGSVDTDWSKPCNWTPASVPTTTNDVELPTGITNYPTIAAAALAKSVWVKSGATLTISTNGSLTINDSRNFVVSTPFETIAFYNQGTVQNDGLLTLGNTASIGRYGIDNSGTFNNNTGANINIDRSTSKGLSHVAGTFANAGTITIGGIASVGFNGLSNDATFNNTGIINIDRSTSTGLRNNNGTFTNDATITIGGIASVGTQGLHNLATFNNNACGKLIVKDGGIRNNTSRTITNTGYVQVDQNLRNDGTFTNNSVLKYAALTGSVTSATAPSVIVNDATPIFTYGGTYDGTVNGIFTNATATTSAGNFTAPNTFVPASGLTTAATVTLYAKITQNNCTEAVVVPFVYKMPPTITSFPATACVGSSLVIMGTNLTGATAVSIGGIAVGSFVVNSATQITAIIATGNTGTISITTPNGVAVSSSSFTAKNVLAVPTISGNNEICEGLGTTLLASSPFSPSQQSPVITYQWSGGLMGSNILVSPLTTRTYRVAAVADGCSSDSSLVFTLTVNPKPAKPSITADNLTICKGGSVLLTGTCSTANASFRWTTPPFNSGNQIAALPAINNRNITEPGIYKGLCESDKGCLSEEVSITITQSTDCGNQNFITITPERPAICPGASITMTATGCAGTLTWTGGATPLTGASVSLSPAATTTYLVQCSTGGSGSFILVVAANTLAVPSNVSTGKERFKAVTTLTSDKKVGVSTFTPGANVIYEAGSSITLLPGFVAEKWSVFKAEIKGCN